MSRKLTHEEMSMVLSEACGPGLGAGGDWYSIHGRHGRCCFLQAALNVNKLSEFSDKGITGNRWCYFDREFCYRTVDHRCVDDLIDFAVQYGLY